MKTRACLLACAALGLGAPAAASDPLAALPDPAFVPSNPVPEQALDTVARRILAAHNRERAAVGHPPLVWDAALAASAAAYGPELARLRRLVHSPREGRPGQRENLAMAWHGTLTPEQLVAMWSEEKRLLQPGLFPAVSRTGRWSDVAHYTQMVWATTTHVGCAIYQTDWDYLICRYSPPGNVDGKPVFASPSLAVAMNGAR